MRAVATDKLYMRGWQFAFLALMAVSIYMQSVEGPVPVAGLRRQPASVGRAVAQASAKPKTVSDLVANMTAFEGPPLELANLRGYVWLDGRYIGVQLLTNLGGATAILHSKPTFVAQTPYDKAYSLKGHATSIAIKIDPNQVLYFEDSQVQFYGQRIYSGWLLTKHSLVDGASQIEAAPLAVMNSETWPDVNLLRDFMHTLK